MEILKTERLTLRQLMPDDEEFLLRLLNDAEYIRFIGDRGVKTLLDARLYIEERFVENYRRNGFGLYLVELAADKTPLGICGFVRRDTLPEVDLGFAFLPEFRSQGYAFESAKAVLEYGKNDLGFKRLLAITTPDNEASGKLLTKLGFKFDRLTKLPGEEAEVKLYQIALS